jgi:hypothetical protein
LIFNKWVIYSVDFAQNIFRVIIVWTFNHGCWGKHAHIPDNDYWGICLFHVVWTIFFLQLFGIYFYFFSSTEHCAWAVISPKEFKSWVTQIRSKGDFKSKSQNIWQQIILFSRTVMQRICAWPKIWTLSGRLPLMRNVQLMKKNKNIKYLIQKFHDICLSYYFKYILPINSYRWKGYTKSSNDDHTKDVLSEINWIYDPFIKNQLLKQINHNIFCFKTLKRLCWEDQFKKFI